MSSNHAASDAPLLRAEGLTKVFDASSFFAKRPVVRAVDGVDLHVGRGETLGIVGESGSGKSTLGRLLLRLIEPTAGTVTFDGASLTTAAPEALRALRPRMQMVFQDPGGALHPRMAIGAAIGEPLRAHGRVRTADEERSEVLAMLTKVGLDASYARRYPHELSGGQRQRAVIARALALRPSLVVCDEPVAALDVSVQAQVVNLLRDLQDELGLSYVFVAHDLSVVRFISQRVAVMYLGRIVEQGDAEALYADPLHPYTRTLLEAVPVADPARARHRVADARDRGEIPRGGSASSGCAFRPRCDAAIPGRCDVDVPALRLVRRDGDTPREVACHRHA